MILRSIATGLVFALLVQGQAAKVPPASKNVVPKAPKSPKNPPFKGPQTVDKLSRLSPEERQKALAQLPPQRRQSIEKRLQDFDKMSPAQQARVRERLDKLNALTPERRAEVRRSVQTVAALPQERKQQLNREVRKLAAMEPAARERYTASQGFRDKYSESDRHVLADLVEVAPTPPGK